MRWRPTKAERERYVCVHELANQRLRDELAVTRQELAAVQRELARLQTMAWSWQDHVSGMDRLHGRGDNDGGAA